MFNECKSFDADLSNWDITNVITAEGMFYNCKSIRIRTDLTNWKLNSTSYINKYYVYY